MADFSALRAEFEELLAKSGEAGMDRRERAKQQKRIAVLQDILTLHDSLTQARDERAALVSDRESEQDEELLTMIDEELATLSEKIALEERELDDLLYPADEHDARNVYLEIRAGAGGQEAALFAENLFEMYKIYAESQRWNVTIEDFNRTDIGGYKELVVFIKGKNAYKKLKFEAGVHRVQRVPYTETQGRVHTSTVTVAVMPEADEVDVNINPSDIRVDTYRASGAGGQHVNKTDSAVRLTHIPTGVVVQCQDERSQIKNKARAMKMLQSRLLEAEKAKHAAEQSANRKQQVGSGDRSEKIRTYNYPQNRVTDHRIGLTLKKLDLIMQGQLEEIVQALLDAERRAIRQN